MAHRRLLHETDPHNAVLQATIVAMAVAMGGCRTFQPMLEATSVPGQYQHVVDSFRIQSSFLLADDDALLHELVRLRGEVQSSLQLAGPTRRAEIYIFDDRSRYDQFMQRYYPGLPRRRAFFIAQDGREVVYAFRDDKLIEDLRHESCHALLHMTVGPVPLWLDEGLAEYFETPGGAQGLHPRHVEELQAALRQGWRPSLTRLEAITSLSQMTASDYREAWAWVYWLMHGTEESRQVLLGYLEDLRQGVSRETLSTRVFAVAPRPDVAMMALIQRLEPEPVATTGARAVDRDM